jgi:dihydroorotase
MLWLRAQDPWLSKGGVAASGAYASRLGLPGIPQQAETIALNTLFDLQRTTGVRLHICRLSSAAGIELVRAAKREGLNVTCDVSANHVHLTDVDIGYYDSNFRLDPPLRGQRDRDAIRAGLADGTIDVVCSDHTPVDDEGKMLPFAEAEPGSTGLELLLSLTLKWAQDAKVPLVDALARVTSGPGRVLAASSPVVAQAGQLAVGAPADLCIVDPNAYWQVSRQSLLSQSKHTPVLGIDLPGRVQTTIVRGQVAWELAG